MSERIWFVGTRSGNDVTLGMAVLLAIATGASLVCSAAGAQDGTLAGSLRDAQDNPVKNAVVMVCDHATGIPVSRDTYQPFTQDMQFQQILFALTDEVGTFAIRDVKPGIYRLIAQSWEDADKPVDKLLDVHGREVRLHGVFPQVRVPSDEATGITLRPLGAATLDITTAPQAPNDETLLVVSAASLAADPILGFAAWSGSFMPRMLAGNRMPRGKTVFRGLPAGMVHLAAFAADNNPGFGGITCELAAGRTTAVSIPLIASWSDGYKQPPASLELLVTRLRSKNEPTATELIRRNAPAVAKALDTARLQPRNPWRSLIPVLNEVIEIPELNDVIGLAEGRQLRVKDLLAAEGYARLLKQDEDRKNRQKQNRLRELDIDSSTTYEQALRDLYDQLGRDYPCFQLKEIDWWAVGERLLPRVKDVDTDEQFGLLCLELVAALEDSHAQVLPAAAQLPAVPFPNWDAGFACLKDDRGKPVVYFVVAGSPAASAGLQIGMMVEQINGVAAAEAIAQTMKRLSRYVGYSSDRYLRYHAVRFFARQAKQGESLTLQVSDTQDREQTLHMKAERVAGYIPRLPVPLEGIADAGNVSWKMLEDDIGYIYVRRIKPDLIALLDQAVKELGAARGLIIDARGNSGGGFDAQRSHRNFDLEDGAEPARPRFTKDIALLVDARCISAGEGWASWFVARQRARLFGEATAGASSRKTTYTLSNGLLSVRYPVKAYRGFLDRPIERRGLEPDVTVTPNAQDLAWGRDTVLETAKKYLLDQVARESY